MEAASRVNDMLLLFDNYSEESRKLHESFLQAGYTCPAVVIEDDGFLPDGVLSVYGFFLGKYEKCDDIPGKPRYFNQIKVPEFWEISGTNSSGEIHDMENLRARIFYAKQRVFSANPMDKRLVRVVEWYDTNGKVRFSDHYNRYGALWARTTFNAKGQRFNKSYFDAKGREIIVENYVTKDIILNEGDVVRIFPSKTDLVRYYFVRADIEQTRLFYNTLSTSFFVSEAIGHQPDKCDILFWQEHERDDIPGNMQIILDGTANRTDDIIVQNRAAYEKLIRLGAAPERLHMLGYVYPFEKDNDCGMDALICTNSDNIEQCSKIVEALPKIHFHIAALTEMSSKLMAMQSYDNVTLYPCVKRDILEELFDKSSYYLDINHESEIVSAVYRAFLHNQLIYAFKETKHNADFVADENIYVAADADLMIEDIRAVMNNPQAIRKKIARQQEAAAAESKEAYEIFDEYY